MNEINEEAYMNGYNWDAFFNYYLEENAPDILESLESDQRVAHVTVSTAQGENDSSTSATIQIVFAGPLDVEGDGGSKEKGAGDGAA